MGQSEPGRITLEGIRLDPSGWDPTGSNQTGLDGADWAGLDPNRSNWTGEDEAEQGRMGSEPENIRASVGSRVIPVPLQMEAAGLCSRGGLAALPMEQGSKSHRDPPGGAGTGWVLPCPSAAVLWGAPGTCLHPSGIHRDQLHARGCFAHRCA